MQILLSSVPDNKKDSYFSFPPNYNKFNQVMKLTCRDFPTTVVF